MSVIFCVLCTQIALLITNGPSDDRIDEAATAAADGGISVFAVGECSVIPHCEFRRRSPLRFLSDLSLLISSLPFAVENSCLVHLNSLDSAQVFVRMCKIIVFECSHAGVCTRA